MLILVIEEAFQSGRGGENVIKEDLRTPREKVVTA